MDERHPLTRMERIVADQYAEGASFKDIAEHLGRSPHTVRSHLKSIFRKLRVQNKIDLRKELAVSRKQQWCGTFSGVSEIQADLALYRSTLRTAGKFEWSSQIACADVFRDLSERHPTFSGAHAGLSFTRGYIAFATQEKTKALEQLDIANAHGETALSLNPFNADAHLATARSLIFQGDFEKGESHIRLALECDSGCEWAQYMLVFILTHNGRQAEAINIGESILGKLADSNVLEPLSLSLACAYFHQKDMKNAARVAESLLLRRRAYGHLMHTACAILAEANRKAEIEAFARSNEIKLCALTPLQYRLHERNGTIIDVMMRQRYWLKGLFSHEAAQRPSSIQLGFSPGSPITGSPNSTKSFRGDTPRQRPTVRFNTGRT